MSKLIRFRLTRVLGTLAAAILITTPVLAAQGGTVTGQVTDSRSGAPVGAVQVFIQALDLGGLSQQNGRYLLQNVPAGTHQLSVARIGYRTISQQITVGGGTVEQNFTIAIQALALDEIVVTGTAGGTQRRAIGNVVGQVRASEITEIAAITNMQDLMGGREPGLSFMRGSGMVGTGSPIRIRGIASLSLNSQPLIFVDGIRVDNSYDAGPNLRDGSQTSTLDDLSPSEIESIEIIKGPAAATLYGTEASAGVIQIITKRGVTGAPQFNVGITVGTNFLNNVDWWVGTAYNRRDRTTPPLEIYQKEKDEGREIFQYGPIQTYTGSMRGGTDNVRYFLSAEYQDHEGIVSYNSKQQTNLRANVSVVASEEFSIDVNMGYVNGFTEFMQQRVRFGLWDQILWANAAGVDTRIRGFLRARPEEIEKMEATRDVSRFTASGTVTHQPNDWLTSRLIIGTDRMDEFNSNLVPRFPEGLSSEFGILALGDLLIDNPVRTSNTLDFASSASFDYGDDFGFTTSIGAQFYERSIEIQSGHGQVFPAPQIRTISGATTKIAGQTFEENKSLGVYVQQEFAWRDRVYLTAAVRGDDNSAFGTDFDAAVYPKFSGTWVVSDEDFWGDLGETVNALRLRSAWGQAGRQPSTFAAVTLYQGQVGPSGQPAVSPNVLGNPDLGPEESTEIEVGFDAAFFDDRASLEFTYYNQTVKNALLSRPVNPTSGFSGAQSVNAGQLSNWGWELNANVLVLDRDGFDWDLGVAWSMNDNKVDDLGTLLPSNGLREGRPFPLFDRKQVVSVAYTDEDGVTGVWPDNIPDPDAYVASIQTALCDGGAGFDGFGTGGSPVPCINAPELQLGNGRVTPKYEASFNTTFTIGQNLRLYAMAEWRGEHWASSTDMNCKYRCGSGRFLNTFRPAKWAGHLLRTLTSTRNDVSFNTLNTSFAYMREISANYTLPAEWAGTIGASRATVNLAARNPFFIWRQAGFGADERNGGVEKGGENFGVSYEPEGRDGGSFSLNNTISNQRLALPALTSFVMSMRVTF